MILAGCIQYVVCFDTIIECLALQKEWWSYDSGTICTKMVSKIHPGFQDEF